MSESSRFGPFDPAKIVGVAEFVLDRRDDLIASAEFAAKAPKLLLSLSGALYEAGDQAKNASRALIGDDGTSGAAATLKSGSTTLAEISGHLNAVTSLLKSASDGVGSLPLMRWPTLPARTATTAMNDVTSGLGDLAGDMGEFSVFLRAAGHSLDLLGTSLHVASLDVRKLLP